ncbi:MAG: PTS system trehalose-specific EIIBC component [Tissierellia bacterium]|nr:PTS system trehalose-specific EIIBC component [Tissierellia bacterium]
MGKYRDDAAKLLEYIGGKENIDAVTHCVTRMRFVLKDPKKADIKKIEALPSVKGSFTQAGQFQVIIGNDVDVFYQDFIDLAGIEGVSKDEVKKDAVKNQNILQRIASVLAEIFAPIIPAIVVGGLILGFRNILEALPMERLGGATIAETYPFWGGVNHFLWLIGEAIFHFLPVGVTWSITRKMGTTQILGIVLGITLVSPQLINAYAVPGMDPSEIPVWDFGFATIDMIGYQAQVIPAMLAGFTLVYLEKFWKKVIPNAISMIFVPLFSLVPTVLLAHAILGPIGWSIGTWISNGVYAGLTSKLNWLFGMVFGGFYAPLVITGLHHMTNAIDFQLAADFGGTILWPMIALSNIAQGSAVLAIIYLHRGNKQEEQISVPSAISAYLGVTEPAMFGINIKYQYPFIAAMIGSAIAGFLSVFTGVEAFTVGVGGLPGILSIKSQYWIPFGICVAIAIVVPFLLTIVFSKSKFGTKVEA